MIDWAKVKTAIGTIAPWIAGTLGTPAAGVAVQALCTVFGLNASSATPDNLAAAIAGASPQQLADLRAAELKHIETMKEMGYSFQTELRRADSADIASVNSTMTAEANNSAAEAWYQKAWRPFNGFVVGIGSLFATVAVCVLAYGAITDHDIAALNAVPVLAGAIAMILGVPGAAVGIAAWHRGVMQVEQIKQGSQP